MAVGDVTGDVAAAAGPGGGPHVKVFDGATGGLVTEFFAFEPGFTGGVFVAAGDVDGDGRADLVAGAGAGGGPRVRAWAGADLRAGPAGRLAADFFAGDPADRGGVTVAVVRRLAADTPAALVAGSGSSGRVTAYRVRPDPVELFALDVAPFASDGVFVG